MNKNSEDISKDKTLSSIDKIKRFGIFQLKLALDAVRDILLSPLSFIMTVVDILHNTNEKDSHFNKLLSFGRKTERRINLFNQHDQDVDGVQTVDDLVSQVEEVVVREYKEGHVSAKTKKSLQLTLAKLRRAPKQAADDQGETNK
ncbi:MAG: hypothetical protein HWE27_05050 [Gammaproteobacteria bacterium]|nr:hypothetical protein [Gammaproteobacteria bacterium]